MTSVALLLLRVVTGLLLIGHGAQKLFGAFGGRGPEGTAAYFEGLGIRPGREWAYVAGATETTGGALIALGLLSPVGPMIASAPMIIAWRKAHKDKPIFVNLGGAELPLTNITIAAALAMAGPGRISLDGVLGMRTPWWMALLVIVATATGITIALQDEIHRAAQETRGDEEAAETAAAGASEH